MLYQKTSEEYNNKWLIIKWDMRSATNTKFQTSFILGYNREGLRKSESIEKESECWQKIWIYNTECT